VLFSGGDGGRAARNADVAVLVPTDNMQIIEDVHMVLTHVIFTLLRDRLAREPARG
jgi:hypothetical protein